MAEPAKRARQPKRPAHLPHGRWLGDLGDLSPFEKRLVAACARGEVCEPDDWDEKRPEADAATEANIVRAELIRFLALGGDDEHPVHELGVSISGCFIKGKLNLDNSEKICAISLTKCRFSDDFSIKNSTVGEIVLDGSFLNGFDGTSSHFKGSLSAKDEFENEGQFKFVKSIFDRDVNFNGSKFKCKKINNKNDISINGNRSIIYGNVYMGALRNSDTLEISKQNSSITKFKSIGEVRFYGADIYGDLILTCGDFSNINGVALDLAHSKIRGCIYFYYHFFNHIDMEPDEFHIDGALILNSATTHSISDSYKTWDTDIKSGNNKFQYTLHGFTYKIFEPGSPLEAAYRTRWIINQTQLLKIKDANTDKLVVPWLFLAQPWEQIIKTLREMGYPNEAANIAIKKQHQIKDLMYLKNTINQTTKLINKFFYVKHSIGRFLRFNLHRIYYYIIGYGHRPIWTVYWMTAVCIFCSIAFYYGRHSGVFGPTNPLIHASASFDICGAQGDMKPIEEGQEEKEKKPYWTSSKCLMPPEYTTFQPFLYSLDLILPLVDLQQDSDWAPIVSNAKGETLWAGHVLRWLMWFEILFGWMASLTLVAVLGRLVDKD